ncbi:hypothetical protein PPERSA_11147 [Pseudocohnilembus persalinus]|uniref:C3H1-type domain-containing protein n=1 Tax=Pseudocohnilembus persalinus TaxID=266149 RepID=A0A0V0QZD0_PSEPJ|nr:hypothetical protein PPERSA_11147 [Pseudocohnilembus persalinus]|eukprot:KRX07598.1 hypothetical protein PPERSA_11147 [Pseudocohnilembus persalinus]
MDEYCQRGADCKYIHDENACKFYYFDGECKQKNCYYKHQYTILLKNYKDEQKQQQGQKNQNQVKSYRQEKFVPKNDNSYQENLDNKNDQNYQKQNQSRQIQYKRKGSDINDQQNNNNTNIQNNNKHFNSEQSRNFNSNTNNNSHSQKNNSYNNTNNNNQGSQNSSNKPHQNLKNPKNAQHTKNDKETELDYYNYKKVGYNNNNNNYNNKNQRKSNPNFDDDQQYALTKQELEQEAEKYRSNRPVNGNTNNIYSNTQTFNPTYEPADLKVRMGFYTSKNKTYNFPIESRDLILVPNLFFDDDDNFNLYNALLDEVDSNLDDDQWKLWHGDNHLIADDKAVKRSNSPIFNMVVEKMQNYFNMDVKATRFNWYRDSSEWKPYHHDAAAVKPDKAKTQNLTIGVSFGAERELSFQHAKSKNTVTFPMPNGTVCAFSKDVNIQWRHGVPQIPPSQRSKMGRISIIAWGWVKNMKDI